MFPPTINYKRKKVTRGKKRPGKCVCTMYIHCKRKKKCFILLFFSHEIRKVLLLLEMNITKNKKTVGKVSAILDYHISNYICVCVYLLCIIFIYTRSLFVLLTYQYISFSNTQSHK